MNHRHVHIIDPKFMTCQCGITAEQLYNGELAHPGKPTSERIWELIFTLAGRKQNEPN